MRKILKVVIVIVLIIILGLFIAPLLLKDKIVNIIKDNINQTINAKVEFKDVDLSFFRSFPNLSVGLEDIVVNGVDEFNDVKLLSLTEVFASVNVVSLIKSGEINVSEIRIEKPYINLIELYNGKQNWDIVKADSITTDDKEKEEETPSSGLNFNIDKFIINNGNVYYDKQTNDNELSLRGELEDINLKFSGNMRSDNAKLKSELSIGALSVIYDKIAYASKLKIDSKIIVDADFNEQKFVLENNYLSVNAIKTSLEGWVSMKDSSAVAMDIKLNTNDISFKEILSLVPLIYKNDFESLKAVGNVYMSLWAKGELKENIYPEFDAKIKVENGSFGYEKLPSRVTDINIDLAAKSKGGVLDNVVASINKFHVNMNGNSVDIEANVTNIETDINYFAKAEGVIDLSKMSDFIPIEKEESLQGMISANLNVKGKMSDIDKGNYENIYANGNLKLEGVAYNSTDLGIIKVNVAALFLSPQYINLKQFNAKVNSSDISMTGKLENMIGYVLNSKTIKGELRVSSDNISLNDFMTSGSDSVNVEVEHNDIDTVGYVIIPQNIDFKLNLDINKLHIDEMYFTDAVGQMTINNAVANISKISMNGLGGNISFNGKYDTTNPTEPKADFNFNVKNASFKKSFESVASLQKMTPIFENITGNYSMSLDVKTDIMPDFSPNLNTMFAKGNLVSKDLSISNVEALDKLANLLNYDKLKSLSVKDIDVSFIVENGRINIKPIDIKAGGINMNISGNTGLDQSIDMKGNITLPSDGVKIMGMSITKLPFEITGTFSKPEISLDKNALSNQVKDNVTSAVKDIISDKIGVDKDSIAAKIDEMTAEKKAQIIEFAKKQAAALVSEAEKQGNKLIEKAGDNKLKIIAEIGRAHV